MPPKNQRGEKRSKLNEDPMFDPSSIQRRFVSKKAKDMFDFIKKCRKPIAERGFDIVRTECGEIFDMIGARGWAKLCAPPKSANISLVREFYANAVEGKDYKVIVRGKQVLFDPETINNYYQLVSQSDDRYTALEESHDLTDIIKVLCDRNVEWKLSRGEKKSFLTNCLSFNMALWYLFITTRIMPVTHISDVTRERAILLYAIRRGIYLNIGKLISRAIISNVTIAKIGLFFPSLISDLCIKASVMVRSDDEWLHPIQPINITAIKRLAAKRHIRDNLSVPATSKKTKAPKEITLNDRMSQIESRQEELKDWAAYQTSYNQFQAENMTSLDSLLRGIATHLQIDTTQYPSSSVCPPHFKFKEHVVDEDVDEDVNEDDEEDDDEEDEEDSGEEEEEE